MRILYKPPFLTSPYVLELTWDSIANVPVANPLNVANWNTFFDLPANGTVFISVTVIGNVIRLMGGSGITLTSNKFSANSHLLEFNDISGCVLHAGNGSFSGCSSATWLYLPKLLTASDLCFLGCLASIECPELYLAGDLCFGYTTMQVITLPALIEAGVACFQDCQSTSIFNLPLATVLGEFCFNRCYNAATFYLPSVGNLGGSTSSTGVFEDISGQTITLTVPLYLMTCWYGLPDNDIQLLQSNNNVTIIQV